MKRRFLLVVGLIACLVSPIALATDAYVYGFDGLGSGYQIRRAGKAVSIAVYLGLEQGDEIIVQRDTYSLALRYGDGREVTVTAASSPYLVDAGGSPPNRLENLLAWASATLEDLAGKEDLSRVNLVTRGRSASALLVPPVPKSWVAPGTTNLLIYVGSAIPADVRLLNSQRRFLSLEPLRAGQLAATGLLPADYPLQILVRQETYVIESKAPPVCPMVTRPEMKEACLGWLAAQEDGRWVFFALTQLTEQDSPTAQYLSKTLLYLSRRSRFGLK